MKRLWTWLPLAMTLLVLPGCGLMQQKAAVTAVADAEAAYSRIEQQATNVAPDQATTIVASIGEAKASLAKGDYAAALATAKDAQDKIKALAEGLPDLQAKLVADWKDLSTTVPGALAALKTRLADYGRPPVGMPDRARFDAVSAQYGLLGESWSAAQSLFVGDKLAEAVAKAESVKADAVKLVAELQAGS